MRVFRRADWYNYSNNLEAPNPNLEKYNTPRLGTNNIYYAFVNDRRSGSNVDQ